jgi:hypothetical protein
MYGTDRLGNSQSNFETTLKAASIIPIGKLGTTANSMNHIYRDAVGHVNPTTLASQTRYLKLFDNVASNPNNLVLTLNPAAERAGVQTFQQTFRNGSQVWVQTLNGQIRDAGVNIIPK